MSQWVLIPDVEAVPDLDVPHERIGKSPSHVAREWLYPEQPPHAELYPVRDFPPPPCWKIVCVGYCLLEDYKPTVLKTAGEWEEEPDEEKILRGLWRFMDQRRPRIVTWNGRRFDMPVILTRSMKYGIPWGYWYSQSVWRYRYSDAGHLDLMDAMADFGAAPQSKMEYAAKMIGLPGKPEGVDGKGVDDMMKEGRFLDVKRYCLSDVVQEAALFFRYEVLRGRLSAKDHDASLEALRELASAAPLPDASVWSVKWDRLMLDKKSEVGP